MVISTPDTPAHGGLTWYVLCICVSITGLVTELCLPLSLGMGSTGKGFNNFWTLPINDTIQVAQKANRATRGNRTESEGAAQSAVDTIYNR